VRLLLFGVLAAIHDAIEKRVPRTFRIGDKQVRRGMTLDEVQALLGRGRGDPRNRTRKIDVEIYTFQERYRARFQGGRLRSIKPGRQV
jgi:hypothetical protein